MNLTAEQQNSINGVREAANQIIKQSTDESINGSLLSRDASQIKKAVDIMAKDLFNAIADDPFDRNEDAIIFVRDTLNLVSSQFLLNASMEVLQSLAINISELASNWSACHENIRAIDESVRSLELTVKTRNGFEMLVRRTEHLVAQIGRVENMMRIAPQTADHMMAILRKEQKS